MGSLKMGRVKLAINVRLAPVISKENADAIMTHKQ